MNENPFRPGFGRHPSLVIGRDGLLESFDRFFAAGSGEAAVRASSVALVRVGNVGPPVSAFMVRTLEMVSMTTGLAAPFTTTL